MKNLISAICLLLLGSCVYSIPTNAQSAAPDLNTKINDYVEAVSEQFGIPGVALAVVKNGKIIHKKNYGYASLEHQVPISDQSIFRVYSLTKPVVSVGIFQLIEQGKLSLEDEISNYVDGIPESWKKLKIKHLLTHSSGLPDMAPFYDFMDLSEEEAKQKVFGQPIKFGAGENYEYNQTNFWLLHKAIERITKTTFEKYILENQFAQSPDTAFFSSDSRDIVLNRVTAYFPFAKGEIMIEHPYMQGNHAFAMNGLNITLDAYIDWDEKLRTDQLLQPSSKQKMLSTFPYKNSDKLFAYNWDKRILNGHDSYGFSGSLVTAYRIFPDDQLSIIFLGNGMARLFNIENIINDIAHLVDEDIFDINARAYEILLTSAQEKGFQALQKKYQDLKAQYPNENIEFEDHLNSIGYQLLNARQNDLAIQVFQFNTQEFPDSWNTYDICPSWSQNGTQSGSHQRRLTH